MTEHEPDNKYRLAPSLRLDREPRGRLTISWRDPRSGLKRIEPAGPDELLGIKIVTERLSVRRLARRHQLPVSRFYRLLSYLDRRGILQAPPTLLRRDPHLFGSELTDDRLTVTLLGLQWHITNACDLHCRHCYDRTRRSILTEAQALRVLDDFEGFCRRHWVVGDISFTGGNPFLHPRFLTLYQEAVRKGFDTSIMGNPVEREEIEAVCRIRPPDSYQMSLEGRRSHNDSIRGPGSYDRVMAFAGVLKELGVPCNIMLTATSRNLGEILPLAALLKGKVDGFTFSRLCLTGEGAALEQPDPVRYRAFLARYLRQAEKNETLGLKENLMSLSLVEMGREVSDGCTGFGCGAAFNGFALLADGEVHACRRFPSLLGNIKEQRFEDLYFSKTAAEYRRGMSACDGCPIRHACGGCMAAAQRPQGRVEMARDQFCWKPGQSHD